MRRGFIGVIALATGREGGDFFLSVQAFQVAGRRGWMTIS
jgi:hypothetical protein